MGKDNSFCLKIVYRSECKARASWHADLNRLYQSIVGLDDLLLGILCEVQIVYYYVIRFVININITSRHCIYETFMRTAIKLKYCTVYTVADQVFADTCFFNSQSTMNILPLLMPGKLCSAS